MILAVMQPTYIPWAGYFNLIERADHFVFLDDVQFVRGSWQARNRILSSGIDLVLTVPTRRVSLQQEILDVVIDDSRNWRKKHLGSIRVGYAKKPFGSEVLDVMATLNDTALTHLADLDMRIIASFVEKLGLSPTQFHRSSALGITGSRSERLLKLAQRFGCQTYLSPVGAKSYLEEDGLFEGGPVELVLQHFETPAYPQGAQGFVSHLSLVDVVANLGWEGARAYIQGAHGEPAPL